MLSNLLPKVEDSEKVWRDNEVENDDGDMCAQPGYAKSETTENGTSGIPGGGLDLGLIDGHIGKGVTVELVKGKGHGGKWKDESDAKGKRFGLDVGGKVIGAKGKTKKLKNKIGSTVSTDIEALSGSLSANFNRKEGFSLGGGVNAVQVRGQVGNEDKNFVRGGFSVGEGGGVRGHWGKNKDGKRQIGFGMDIGPVTFDLGVTGVPKWMKKGGKQVKKLLNKINHA